MRPENFKDFSCKTLQHLFCSWHNTCLSGSTFQLWAGPDMVGFNTSFPNTSTSGGDFGVKQAFVDLHVPIGTGLDVKIGHFDYIGGFEVPEAGNNPNYSRSFAWTQEPASHTG